MTRIWPVVAVLAVLAVACSGGGGGSTAGDKQAARNARRAARQAARCQRRATCPSVPDTGLPGESSPGTTAPSGPLKPVLQGLLDRDGEPPSQYIPTAVRGWVVKVDWKDLQPAQNGPIAADNTIDRAVAAARKLGVGLKLRIYAGTAAPDWAKALGGGPVSVVDPQGKEPGTIPRFWTGDFGKAYGDLQAKLAAKYDDVPEVREVVVSRCTTFFAEPFLRDKGDKGSVANMLAAGFTDSASQSERATATTLI